MRARVLIACVQLLLQGFITFQTRHPSWLLGLSLAYVVATSAVLRWARPRQADSVWSPRWAMTLWMDLAVFALLHIFQQAAINYTPLFALPVLLAAILGPLLLALGSAATATLVLLFDAWNSTLQIPDQSTTRYLQAALAGSGLFLVALLANQLALRLIREQAQALRSQALARTESEISALIVGGLNEGVVVLNGSGKLWHANPAACTMLDAVDETPASLQQAPGWPVLAAWVQSCQVLARNTDSELALPTRSGEPRKLRVRARLVLPLPHQRMEQACVVFLQDLREVEARIHTEKLAAMGRLSAAVAHEIRNPLAAISQANALLAEDALEPAHQRLVTMIGQNAKRLGRTVDDILNTVRNATSSEPTPPLPLDSTTKQVLADWLQLHPQGNRLVFTSDAPHAHVPFDPEHFQRVLVNLLDNANRHAAQAVRAIHVHTTANETSAQLTVWSQGPELPPQVQQHLFEPFASTHSRSSGLGLYICREMCQRHGANLAYRPQTLGTQTGNAFTLTFTHSAK